MKYDFTTVYDRVGKDAIAVENIGQKIWGNEPAAPKEGFSFIPMWVADMNFATCPAIVDSIKERLNHPLFGYYFERPEYYDSIIRWQTERHGYRDLKKEYISYHNGVHGFITSAVNVLTKPGDAILLQQPYYTGFCSDIEFQGRHAVHNILIQDGNGVYRIDYEDLDRKLKENSIHLAIFCSPHNPTGRVWEQWELEKALQIFEANECYVISDEMWADIVFDGHTHTPLLMVNDWAKEHVMCAYALSKTFNLAGMNPAYSIIYNKYLRDRVVSYAKATSLDSQNILSMYALLGAYSSKGQEWTEELNAVLETNCRYVTNFLNGIEGVYVTMAQGTYMLFVNLTDYCQMHNKTMRDILEAGWDVGVGWQDGNAFGGTCHIRMNVALPFTTVKEACTRLKKYVFMIDCGGNSNECTGNC